MFLPIYAETPAARLVDWLEFRTLLHEFGETPLEFILDAIGISEDAPVDAFEEDDPDDVTVGMNEDTAREQVFGRVEREIERRMEALRDAYPFVLTDGMLHFCLNDTKYGQLSYLLCLRLSIPMSSVLDETILPPIQTQAERNLFQHCANLAAAGYLGGKVCPFGWNRPDKTGLLNALRVVEKAMEGEGDIASFIPLGVPARPKDDKLDVVAWIPHADGPGCALTLWGQVASGMDWGEKAFSSDDVERFRRRWYSKPPALPPVRAMFVPFCLFDDVFDRNPGEYLAMLKDQACVFGMLFHRYRLPACVQQAFEMPGEVSVMRELPKSEVARLLGEWWAQFSGQLRQAAEAA